MVTSAFDQENIVLNPPSGMENDCESISAFIGKDVAGKDITISCWKLTKEEVEELLKTGRLWLIVSGNTMPPVALTGKNPWGE